MNADAEKIDLTGADWALFASDIKQMARALRDVKEAHTMWEQAFEGPVPEHDWENWYAQQFFVQGLREAGFEVKPLPTAELQKRLGSPSR